jgi:signal transduction histidine kinase
MTKESSNLNLNKPLPPEVVFLSFSRLARYRIYPVFSLRWIRGRFLIFSSCFALYVFLVFLGHGNDIGWSAARNASAALLFSAILTMFFGPALATAIRYAHWSARKEATGVVCAILLGIFVSSTVNHYTLDYAREQSGRKAKHDAKQEARINKLRNAPTLELISQHIYTNSLSLIIYVFSGGGFALFAYFRERTRVQASLRRRELARANDARREAEMRLSLLQAQVEPHFLFNTLAGLRSMIGHDPAAAQGMVDKLVDYLRAAIPKMRSDGEQEPPTLGDQIDIVKSYLELMQIRMGKRLSFDIQIPTALRDAQFPPLMLISLVENALKHGLEPKPQGGHLHITAHKEGRMLTVTVTDNGVGFGGAATSGSGIGLSNIKMRLAQIHGARAALTLKTPEHGGLAASITLPSTPTSSM